MAYAAIPSRFADEGIAPIRSVADAAATINTHDTYVVYSTLTASRIATLPLAASVPPMTKITIQDGSGNGAAGVTLTFARAGADTINGAASVVAVNTAYGRYSVIAISSTAWLGAAG